MENSTDPAAPTASIHTTAPTKDSKSAPRNKNFTWEHFFVEHCGILKEDALRYERNLISHRMDLLHTLLEYLTLIVEYGQIPIGDKIKLTKTLERQAQITEELVKEMSDAVILELTGGQTDKISIDWGIEQYMDMIEELRKNRGHYVEGKALVKRYGDPSMKLLRTWGYETFNYTRGKEVAPTNTANLSQNRMIDILFGSHTAEKMEGNVASMYT